MLMYMSILGSNACETSIAMTPGTEFASISVSENRQNGHSDKHAAVLVLYDFVLCK